MNPLLITGAILTGVGASVSLAAMFSAANRRAWLVLCFAAACMAWNAHAMIFRAYGSMENSLYFIAAAGIALPVAAWSWLGYMAAVRFSGIRPFHFLCLALPPVALAPVFFLSGLATDVHRIDSGLFRYQLTLPGHILFGLAYLYVFVGVLLAWVGSGSEIRRAHGLPAALLGISMLTVIVPWKELGLPSVLPAFAALLMARQSNHRDDPA